MKYTEVFLNKFKTGENAVSMRQVLGITVEEIDFMLNEVQSINDITVSLKNDQDAVNNTFELSIKSPTCKEYEALRFLMYNINQGTYGVTAGLIPAVAEADTDKLDSEIIIKFTTV